MVTLPRELLALRERAKMGRDPVCADETLACLLETAERTGVQNILEIGAAEGLTSIALLAVAARAVAIERDPARAMRARENFKRFGVAERVTLYEGDAGEILPRLEGPFGLVFLDGPKAQYLRYLPQIKRLLAEGGYLFSDDVLLFGKDPPAKRKALARHIGEYVDALRSDPDFRTEILGYGEGLAVSIYAPRPPVGKGDKGE